VTAEAKPLLAIVLSHPTQYYSPWFRHISAQGELKLRVFYLWDFGVQPRMDVQFGQTVQWDIPLLDGYDSEFVPNDSRDPGTHWFGGLDNPRSWCSATRPGAICACCSRRGWHASRC
jgi:hypothetical protein